MGVLQTWQDSQRPKPAYATTDRAHVETRPLLMIESQRIRFSSCSYTKVIGIAQSSLIGSSALPSVLVRREDDTKTGRNHFGRAQVCRKASTFLRPCVQPTL
jgi:hypothetical protein